MKKKETKFALFSQIHWLILVFKSDLILSCITALQPFVLVTKDIFPFATIADVWKKPYFMEFAK